MKWFRWHDGTCADGKFQIIAREAEVPVATVIGVWAILLEDAGDESHRGIATRGINYYSLILDLGNEEIKTILNSMVLLQQIEIDGANITITNWNKRQFETDLTDQTNGIRQKRWRQKHKRNGTVTVPDGNGLPDTDTEADTERKKEDTSLCSIENVSCETSQPPPADNPKKPSKEYFFEIGIIKLNEKDFKQWEKAFSYLDLRAELVALSPWAEREGSKWFHAVPGALAKRNREQKTKIAAAKETTHKWTSGIEGVV